LDRELRKTPSKKILFISWDGYQTTYAEGLFMPIFQKVTELSNQQYQFHYLQFSNASKKRTAITKATADKFNIPYQHVFINKYNKLSPLSHLSAIITLLQSPRIINKILKENHFDAIMPRSIFPAAMMNRMRGVDTKIIYDADGLAADERVDFKGLKKSNFRYKYSLRTEQSMFEKADHVITRSEKCVDVHQLRIPTLSRDLFTVINNGRDKNFFKPNAENRNQVRKELGVDDDELLLLFSGSLGDQYGWKEMVEIVRHVNKKTKAKWLVLTVNKEFAQEHLPADLTDRTMIKHVPFNQMANYLNAGDVAFAIRQPSFSMQGVCPIKLGEYLMMGLPTIASKGIGDTEDILNGAPSCFMFDHDLPSSTQDAANWIENLQFTSSKTRDEIREYGVSNFSLEQTAEAYITVLNSVLTS